MDVRRRQPCSGNVASPAGVFFDNNDGWEANVTVNNNGCTADATLLWEAPDNPVAVVEDQYQFCTGLTMDFNNLSENAASFAWNFGDGLSGGVNGTSTDINPTYVSRHGNLRHHLDSPGTLHLSECNNGRG